VKDQGPNAIAKLQYPEYCDDTNEQTHLF